MDGNEVFEALLQKIDADKRDEAYAKLAAVETRAEKLAIMDSYGVAIPTTEDSIDADWIKDAVELTDEQLDQISGGDLPFGWKRDCNCEP